MASGLKSILTNPKTGHVSIRPATYEELLEWASLSSGQRFTRIVKEAIVDIIVKGGGR